MDVWDELDEKPGRKRRRERAGSLYSQEALVVGLTGGAATGKTTVACMFEDLGAIVASADEIVHELLRQGTDVWRAVVHEFGQEVLSQDGNIDRRKLGEIVFRSPKKRARLEGIVHPPVLKRLAEEADRFRKRGHGVLILEIPLLVETSSLGMVDKVLLVVAEQKTQVQRLQKRYGISREAAVLRIGSQLPITEKLKYADWIVSTEGTLQSTKEQVERIWFDIQKSLAQHK